MNHLTSGSWADRNETRLTGSIEGDPLVTTTKGKKLVATFTVCTLIQHYCNHHRITAMGELARSVVGLKKGELVKVSGRLRTNGEILAWSIIAFSSEGKRVLQSLGGDARSGQ